jgi:hypothetical protein
MRFRIVSRVVVLAALAVVGAAPAAEAKREVPVGLYNVNNQVMNSRSYVYALRFVLDRETTMHRFISGFNLEGSDHLGGREGYADGAGGTIRARLVEVKASGEPDLSRVVAEETVSAVKRYEESKALYGAPGKTQLLHFETGGVTLQAGRMYAMTFQNVDPDPAANWFSENSPTVKESEAGPNGRNNLDPDAPGAIAGLDAREAVAWSKDGGSSWVWGRRAGEGPTAGAYAGSATSDDGTRLPWYGWQQTATSKPQSNQPYYAYKAAGAYTLTLSNSPREAVLTEAGGYAPVGAGVGVVTVRNLSTGAVGRTGSLGTGLQKGNLDRPVAVLPGQSYEISNSGTVLKSEGDSFINSTFGLGSGAWTFHTAGFGTDRAELFALPHPWFMGPSPATVEPVPAPAPVPAPEPAPVPSPAPAKPGARKGQTRIATTARQSVILSSVRRRGRTLRVRGRVIGASRGSLVRIQVRMGGRWRTVGRARIRAQGVFARRLQLRRKLPGGVRVAALASGARSSSRA